MSNILLVANKIGSLWIPLLLKDKSLIGVVENVFRRTINIRHLDNMLLSITALNYSSPAYINVTLEANGASFQKYVRPYDEVVFKKPYIVVGNIKIKTSLNKRVYYFPKACNICGSVHSFINVHDFLSKLYKTVLFFVNIIEKPNNILELLVKSNLEHKIYSIARHAKNYVAYNIGVEPLLNDIYQLLGLGFGVTPSTDDFIGGLLGTLNIYLSCNKRTPIVLDRKKILSKTSWVSGYLLYYNHLGLFNSIFEDFVENLFKKNLKKSIDSFLSLMSIGHTSGLDMSLGALLALAIIGESTTHAGIIDEYFDLFFRKFIVKYRK